MELSLSQQTAAEKFEIWYKDPKKMTCTISGVAGTGKTFLVEHLINKIIKYRKYIGVSAYTHKAVGVISRQTKIKGLTLHSLHGLRPSFDLIDIDLGKIRFEEAGESKFSKYRIIFIDEASMISEDLASLNKLKSLQFNTKLVYIGDAKQLAPVKESGISNIFTEVDEVFELTEIIRQESSNPLLSLFPIIRADIDNDTGNLIKFLYKHSVELNHKNVGYATLDGASFKDIAQAKFSSDDFKYNVNSVRICAYTNDRIIQWNRFIRSIVVGEDVKDIIVEGDVLMGYKTIVNHLNATVLINALEYRVVKVTRILTEDKFLVYDTHLRDTSDKNLTNVKIVDHKSNSFNRFYNKLLQLYRNAIYSKATERGKNWRIFYEYKDQHITMVDFELRSKDSSLKGYVSKELDYGYAVTVHKLQGTTITDIMIDMMDIAFYKGESNMPRRNTSSNPNAIDTRNRISYTALSRASKRAMFLLY